MMLDRPEGFLLNIMLELHAARKSSVMQYPALILQRCSVREVQVAGIEHCAH